MRSLQHFSTLFFILLAAIQAQAVMSDKAVFARCYAQLVGAPVPLNFPDYLLIKQGKKRAVEACADLLRRAKLDGNGELALKGDPIGKSVLNILYEFHRTWFPTSQVGQILGYRQEFDSRTNQTLELSSPALALTWSALAEAPYQSVVQGQEDYYAVRDIGGDMTATNVVISGLDANGQVTDLNMPGPAANGGSLSAIRKMKVVSLLGNYSIPGVTASAVSTLSTVGTTLPMNLFQNFGGGILGQQSFFALNNGHIKGQIFDGALKVPRKWAKTAMESMMCLTLPSLRENDVRSYVSPGSSVPFRKAASCITCHASMDQMAATARNLTVVETGPFNQQKTLFVSSYAVQTRSPDTWPAEGDAQYRHQSPIGKLMYRSYANGALVNLPVSSMDDLGVKISQTTEFYQCAAKRYFEYFTGISVSLYDRTNPNNGELNKNLTARDVKDRAFVESLGESLRKNQSLSQMILEIIQSPYYRSSTFNPEQGN